VSTSLVLPRMNNTRDALAVCPAAKSQQSCLSCAQTLHAYHICLAQLASQKPDDDSESRLRQSIAKESGLEETDERISSKLY
jgi:hypothetical protein